MPADIERTGPEPDAVPADGRLRAAWRRLGEPGLGDVAPPLLLLVGSLAILTLGPARSPTHRAQVGRLLWQVTWGSEEVPAGARQSEAELAARDLGELGSPLATPAILRRIRCGGAVFAQRGIVALGRLGDPGALPVLERFASPSQEPVFGTGTYDRSRYCRVLHALRGEGGAVYDPRILGALRVTQQRAALEALGHIGDPRARRVLLEAMRPGEPLSHRITATFALGGLDDPSLRRQLEAIARDPGEHPEVRKAAYLGRLHGLDHRGAMQILDELRGIDDPTLRDPVVERLGGLLPAASLDAYRPLARQLSEPAQTGALLATGEDGSLRLALAGTPGFGPAVEKALYYLAEARAVAAPALHPRLDRRLCRLARHRQGWHEALNPRELCILTSVSDPMIAERCPRPDPSPAAAPCGRAS